MLDNIMFIKQFEFHEDDYSIKSTLPGREERTSREGKPIKPVFYLFQLFLAPWES
jgi:hypothetical protein